MKFFHTIGLGIVILQFWVFAFCIGPFRSGFPNQIEPLMAAVFILSALNALWLATGCARHWLTDIFPHTTLWKIFYAWVVWQCAVTLWSDVPWISWFGAIRVGEGGAYNIALLLCSLTIRQFWAHSQSRTTILMHALSVPLVLAGLHLMNSEPNFLWGIPILGSENNFVWQPFVWASYLVFIYSFVFLAVITSDSFAKGKAFWGMIALFIPIFFISQNKTGMILLPGALMLTGISLAFRKFPNGPFQNPGKIWRSLAVFACLAPLCWIGISSNIHWMPEKTLIADGSDADGSRNAGSFETRMEYNQYLFSLIANEPGLLLHGNGWGRFSDNQFKYGIIDGTYAFKDGKFLPTAVAYNNDSEHAHAQPVEALVAGGVLNLLLWLLIPIYVIWNIPKAFFWVCVPTIVAVTIMGYLWYFTPFSFAFLAMYWFVLSDVTAGKTQAHPAKRWQTILLFFAFLAMGVSGWQQTLANVETRKLFLSVFTENPETYDPKIIEADLARGGERTKQIIQWWLLFSYEIRGEFAEGWYHNMISASRIASQSPHVGSRLALMELVIQNMVFFQNFYIDWYVPVRDRSFLPNSRVPLLPNTVTKRLKPAAMATYPDMIKRLALRAPLREDLAAPYLHSVIEPQLKNKANDEAVSLLRDLLQIAPEHRSALWLYGSYLRHQSGHEEQGLAMQKKAALLGVEKIYPVTDKQLSEFKNL